MIYVGICLCKICQLYIWRWFREFLNHRILRYIIVDVDEYLDTTKLILNLCPERCVFLCYLVGFTFIRFKLYWKVLLKNLLQRYFRKYIVVLCHALVSWYIKSLLSSLSYISLINIFNCDCFDLRITVVISVNINKFLSTIIYIRVLDLYMENLYMQRKSLVRGLFFSVASHI